MIFEIRARLWYYCWMNKYEITLIVAPELSEDEADQVVDGMGVDITNRQKLGKRLFSYPINKKKEGNYILCEANADPAKMKKLDQYLRLNESVIRHLVIAKEEVN